jgi:hypothetical protein
VVGGGAERETHFGEESYVRYIVAQEGNHFVLATQGTNALDIKGSELHRSLR